MNKVSVKFIGSGDAFASGGKLNTCFYLSDERSHVLVDCGASSLIGLKKNQIPLNKIEAIYITHFHGDHFGGLPFFVLDAQLVQKRNEPLTIVGPIGLEKRVKELMEALFKGSSLLPFTFDLIFEEVEDFREKEIGGQKVTYYPVIHSPESNPHGLKLSFGNKVFAYSGDTEWTDDLLDLGAGSNLFIVECYNFEGDLKFHMNYQTLLNKLDQIDAERIMITHLGPEMIEKSVDQLKLSVCQDGDQVII